MVIINETFEHFRQKQARLNAAKNLLRRNGFSVKKTEKSESKEYKGYKVHEGSR